MSTTYAQHESLKHVTFFFEQATLIAQTWPQIVDNLTDLRSKYNNVKNLLKNKNNQLQACYLKLVNRKQALQNQEKDLATMKAQLLKQQTKSKHLVTKGVEVERAIKKAKTLQFEYNELTQVHFKICNDLKTLQTNLDRLAKDYGKVEAINVQQERTMLEFESTCLQ